VSLCFAGMALNFKDGFAWGSFPVFFQHEHGLSASDTDLLIALYPLCWGFAQAFAGALSDKFGRKFFLITGTAMCAAAMASYALPSQIWGIASLSPHPSLHVFCWILSDIVLGLGTALVYPALQAAAADEVDPIHRGLALGFYRFTRDFGYVIGALLCGHLTDWIGYDGTFWVNAAVLSTALCLLAMFYREKSDEETALAVMIANEMEQGTVHDASTIGSTRRNVPVRVLAHRCSDSW
jgi:MFS family permease